MSAVLRSLFFAAGLLGLSATAAAQFLVVEQRASAELASIDEPGVVDAHWVRLDMRELSRRSEVLELEMPDGARHRVQLSNVEQRRPDDLAWRGWLDGGEDQRVTLTLKNGYVAGRIETPSAVFEIQPARDGKHLLLELDLDAFPACAGGVEPGADIVATHSEATPRGTAGTTNMDLLALYTPQARNGAGGVAQIETTIQAAVDNANTAFIDSNMIGRFTLVHTALASYNDSGDLGDDLSWVRNDSGVGALRNTYGADMVGLVVESPGCGIGYVMRNPGPGFEDAAFQVTDRGCAVGNLTYAHEHGHNMGFEHDPANGSAFPSYPYAYGHFISGSYRTVMSYSNQCSGGCTRVAHFSNPDITHNSVATGIANQRDNARAGDNTAPIVAAFRGSVVTGPSVSSPNPADGTTVAPGASGQLLRVLAPDATSGTIHYDDDSQVSWSGAATVNGDFLEITVPYTSCATDGRMCADGTNYWYVEATNASGTTRFPSSGNLSFTVASLPAVSNPNPANGATVPLGAGGQLLRVSAPGATSGTIHYDDDSVISWSDPAVVNGDFLELTVPYTDCNVDGRMGDCGTNYWYVEATNAAGTVRYPASGSLSFSIEVDAPTVSNPSPADGASVDAGTIGQLLRVRAPGATSGTFHYGSDTSTAFNGAATVDGDFLEIVAPYPEVAESGTNYWYVEATNAGGTTRFPATGTLSFVSSVVELPVVSSPTPADGATVSPGATGHLLRVLAPEATSGIIYYGDDDQNLIFGYVADVNGNYLEVDATYPELTDSGTNYWYVVASNSAGQTRYPASGTLSFTVSGAPVSCVGVSEGNATVSSTALLSACSNLTVGPAMIIDGTSDVTVESGDVIRFQPEISIEQGAQLRARTCGLNLCSTSPNPLDAQCHSCVEQVCAVDASCCTTAWDQQCADQVETVCGLSCD